MKKLFSVILLAAMLLSLTACGSAPEETGTPAQNPPTTLQTLKVLAIGNSFSVDAMEHLYAVAKAEGVQEIVLGNLYVGGCTLAMHLNYANSNMPEYTYYKNTTGTWEKTEQVTMLQGLQDEQWDLITMQQGSAASGFPDTYNMLGKLIDYVKENKTNPDAKLAWHMTWAYQGNSTHKSFPDYGSNQQTMYMSIVNAVQKVVVPNDEFAMVLPVGTAIQNARTGHVGDTLTRDGHHLNDLGRVIASYTWYAVLDGQPLQTLNIDRIATTEADKALVVDAVNAAIANPYSVTDIS